MTKSVALYLRVSTSRQAEADLSIPDQRNQLMAYCAARDWQVVAEYLEPGASATDDKRPEFQRMVSDATVEHPPYSTILVHSYSRFFRDAIGSGMYQRKLEKNGVSVLSITQEVGDDSNGKMMKTIISAVDEWSSAETAKHTSRAMKENARQGHWNGSKPPFGYTVVDAGKKGDKVKRKLAIVESEAKVVRLIFDTYTGGKTGKPRGVKATTVWLNEQGYKTRMGHAFSVGSVHRILSSETYIGTYWFNKTDSRTNKARPRKEWVAMACPAIVSKETFEAVQAQLSARSPKKIAPRLVSSPTLLSGIARCSKCGGAMMLRTGTGKAGKIYSYYTCSKTALKGKTECTGQSIRMDKLDALVVEQLTQKVFTPAHVTGLLAELQQRDQTGEKESASQINRLQKELNDARKRIDRLYLAIEDGIAELDETLKDRISALKARKESLIRDIAHAKNPSAIPKQLLKPKHINAFCEGFRTSVINAEKSVQKGLLGMFVDQVTVDKENGEITVTGPNNAVIAALTNKGSATPASVRSSVLEWCPLGDSNPCRRRERAVS